MRWKLIFKILLYIIAFVAILILVSKIIIEPGIEKKILSTLNQNNKGYFFQAEKVNVSLLPSGAEIKNISITSKAEKGSINNLKGEIALIRIKGVNLLKLLFRKDVYIREINISNGNIKGIIPFPEKKSPPIISSLNVRIGIISFDKIELALKYDSTAGSLMLKNGFLKLYELQIHKMDTLTPSIVGQLDFQARELFSVSYDSMYSFYTSAVRYTATSKTMEADSFKIHPNYADYEFTSRHEFQSDRIEAETGSIYFHDFSVAGYLKSGNFECTEIEIDKLKMNIFRDKRVKFRHVKKMPLQDLIYNFPGKLRLDSISIKDGDVTYAEHTVNANNQGKISFRKITARVYNITNDTIYKQKKGYFEVEASSLLMGKGRLSIAIKGRLRDSNNTFSMKGTLSEMEADALNPMLENAAFLFVTAGKIDAMNFSFTANNYKASGQMTLLYHGLDVAVKSKVTDDTTAFKERVISIIANNKLLDSNPLPGKEIRKGIIENERDPEKFLFNYCFKSILSGIKYSLVKNPEKKDKK